MEENKRKKEFFIFNCKAFSGANCFLLPPLGAERATEARRFFVIRYEENEGTTTEAKCFISFGVYSIAHYYSNCNTFFQFFLIFSHFLHIAQKTTAYGGMVLYKLPKPPDRNRGPWYFCLTKSKIQFAPVSRNQNFKLHCPEKICIPPENRV